MSGQTPHGVGFRRAASARVISPASTDNTIRICLPPGRPQDGSLQVSLSIRGLNPTPEPQSLTRDKLATINAQLTKVEAAVDRYLSDYEDNALDRDILARRVDTLASQARQLRRRRDELLLNLDAEPDQPDPAELAAIRDHIIEIVTTGSPEERKALCEATIAELRITGRTTATPVFRIPLTTGTNNSALTGPQPAS